MVKTSSRPRGPHPFSRLRISILSIAAALTAAGFFTDVSPHAQQPACTPPISNPVACENQLPGNPASEWDVSGAGDSTIQGFATDISVDQGQTVSFKIDTNATNYRLDIYRMGYYGGDGARKVATVTPSANLPQNQPNCLADGATGLVDCGNWAVSASWTVPADAVSGIYFARVERTDTGGASHIVFVVRDDDGRADLLFQTSDTTWQAYNRYGGNSLYTGNPVGRAYKVSYNRPFTTRGYAPEDWVFNAEYPMVRWLEANGYWVSYATGVDSDRLGQELLDHKAFLSVGHDEYWSGPQRTNVENARGQGVHLAFFSGNEIFWKTRWENSISGDATPYRTLVSYKETHANAKIDPLPGVWTGTWRDPRFSPPADGGRPENALSGTIFYVNSGTSAIRIPSGEGKMRFWRNTSVANLAAGQTATMPGGTLGYEWDEDRDNGFRPAGLIRMSDTTVAGVDYLQDYGSTYGPGTANHALTLYRHSSGALVFGAGTIQWSWGLDSNHDRGSAAPSVAMQQATVNLFADMGVQPITIQTGLTTAAPSSDTQAPVSAITSPTTSVPANATVTVTGTASDSGGGIVGGVEVSVDGGATWRRATGRETWSYVWSTGGARTVTIFSRAVDDSGNLEQPTGVEITVGSGPVTCPCSIWTPSQAPTVAAENDANAVEVGTRFRADVNGYITAIRFYKSTQNVGPHIGNLWSTGGTLLATVPFSGESTSGWQEMALPSPVAIIANTTYVVSYHTASGYYAGDDNYFASTGVDNGPLHALRNGVDGPNGVYKYGASGFPNQTYLSEGYWVDVVFVTSIGPDTTPPQVTAHAPASGASGVATNTTVTATFNENIDAATVNGTTFELRDASNVQVSATVSYSPGSRTATLQPSTSLAYSTAYTARVAGGASGVKDPSGNALSADVTWSFTTAAPPPPPPTEGPGGPILVVSSSGNAFSRYYAEILRTEGLNAFLVADISTVTASMLAGYDVVILGDMALSVAQATMFSDWVTSGGNLIAMRPDKKLASLMGLTDAGTTLPEGYLLVNTAAAPGAGIVSQTIQFHGTADRYTLSGASSVATLYSNRTTATSNPAVTVRSVGVAGGQAAAFTFDLARSVVYTRQGNPAWSGQERDGVAPIRSDDLFFGGSQADWVDLTKVAIPQADEQQRLLANLIQFVNADRKPLPRFWYLPRGLKAAVVMTGDDHANNGTAGRFDVYTANSPAGCSVADWQCVRATSYIYPSTPLNPSQAAAYNANGFEIGVHITTGCADFTPQSLAADYTRDLGAFAATFSALPAPKTNRTHCITWSDYTTQADVALANGIRFDTNYYYWPPGWVNDVPGLFTGSGMPMRFARTDGTMVDVYQATTQMTDESGQTFPFTINALLDRALGSEGFYGVFTANMHTDTVAHAGSEAIVASALSRNVPVVSARQMLEWLDGRNGSSFANLAWVGNSLTFSVAVGTGANGLQALLPANAASGPLTGILKEGVPVAYTLQTIKGLQYAAFTASAGNYQADYVVDATGPVISNVNVVAGQTTATVTWTTSEPATSTVNYGLSAGSLTSSVSDTTLKTSHSIQLTGLTASTQYFYQATSADAASNATTAPSTPGSFTTTGNQPPPPVTLADTTVADFAAGTADSGIYVSETANGEVQLAPAVGAEFPGNALPAGWTATAWNAGGAATVAGGILTVDGALVHTDALFTPGAALEFEATFSPAAFEHAGFGVTLNESLWAVFSTGTGGALYARTHNGTTPTDSVLPGTLLNTPHRYRIEWGPSSVTFAVDGTVVATHAITIGASMRPVASNFDTGGGSLTLNWMRLSPYASAGTFVSRVLDAGTSTQWGTVNWTAGVPGDASLAIAARFGNTPTPDGSWSPFVTLPSSGASVSQTSRYAQYRAVLGSTNPAVSPSLQDITFTSGSGPALPTISIDDIAVAEGNAGTTNAIVTLSLSAASANTVTVNYATANGSASSGSDYTAASGTASFAPNTTSTTIAITVVGDTIVESNETFSVNLSAPSGATITDAQATVTIVNDDVAVLTLVDTTTSDFSAGSGDSGIYVTQTANGEVVLAPAAGAEFGGSTLPADWTATPWNAGGTATVSGGGLTVDGARVHTTALFGPGASLEFEATFSSAAFEHAGLGNTLEATPWAIFSTGGGGALYARTHNGTTPAETLLPGSWNGSLHRYRIDWTASSVTFSIDGAPVASHPIAIGASMRPIASNFDVGGGSLAINWMRLSPYATSGTFVSRVLDAGASTSWGTANWTADMPAGTSLALSARFGNTPTPDGSWTPFAGVPSSGSGVGQTSRYVQYQVVLGSTAAGTTPALQDVTFTAAGGPMAPSITIGDRSIAEGNAGTSNAVVTLSLSAPSTSSVTVNYATANGTATAGTDYTSVSGTATFGPNTTTTTIAVPILGDTTVEANETLAINLSGSVNASIADAQGVLTITNDDLPAIAIADVSIVEGNTGTTNAVLTLTLSGPSPDVVAVNFATADGTATAAGNDYTATSGTATFNANTTSTTIAVAIVGDAGFEPNETLVVNLTSPVNATIADAQATVTITNDDGQPSLSIADASVTEGAAATTSTAAFVVSLSQPSAQTITVSFATANGTATAGSDFTTASGILTFAPNETQKTVNVTVIGDALNELNETFVVNLSAPTNATLADNQATGTIGNDDPLPLVNVGNASVTEGNTGSVNLNIPVTLSAPSGQVVTVAFATSNGTAIAGVDYTPTTGTVTFPVGTTSRTAQVPVLGDIIDELAETFTVTLSAPSNATLGASVGTGTINDNDAAPSLRIDDVSIAEGDAGSQTATFTVTLSTTSGRTVTVNYSTANATATAASGDYTSRSGTLSFAAGITSQQVTVAVNGDVRDEADETFYVNLSGASGASLADARGIGTIVDDDPTPTVSINNVSVVEGNTGTKNVTFTLTLSAASGRSITVGYETAGDTALAGSDYTAKTGTVTFNAGVITRTFTVSIIGDQLVEPNETFFVNLTSATNVTIADGQGVCTIVNND